MEIKIEAWAHLIQDHQPARISITFHHHAIEILEPKPAIRLLDHQAGPVTAYAWSEAELESPMLVFLVEEVDNVYADVNSPGFSERIASYHQESNSEVPSSRFSSPGFFPSVRLVKDCVTPVTMSTRPKGRSQVGIRIAPLLPDYTSASSVMEQPQSDNAGESSTHSVLDALKEISRKRIQGGETEMDHRKRYKVEERERDLSLSSGDDSIVSRMSVVET
ncbi:hypothetical protein B566_EDAN010772, partial [Ephemera danica]